jgi:hypothetical protein
MKTLKKTKLHEISGVGKRGGLLAMVVARRHRVVSLALNGYKFWLFEVWGISNLWAIFK